MSGLTPGLAETVAETLATDAHIERHPTTQPTTIGKSANSSALQSWGREQRLYRFGMLSWPIAIVTARVPSSTSLPGASTDMSQLMSRPRS